MPRYNVILVPEMLVKLLNVEAASPEAAIHTAEALYPVEARLKLHAQDKPEPLADGASLDIAEWNEGFVFFIVDPLDDEGEWDEASSIWFGPDGETEYNAFELSQALSALETTPLVSREEWPGAEVRKIGPSQVGLYVDQECIVLGSNAAELGAQFTAYVAQALRALVQFEKGQAGG